MSVRALCLCLIGIICLPAAPVAAQAQERATLWSFLGIPQGCNKIHGALFNRKGKHPGLEKKPPLKSLADPANLESDVPVIKKAAEIKKAEDLKKQKIKAIRYLTEIGCGCYDTDGSVTQALLAASDDCTEEVRLTTVQSIAEAASGKCCEHCGQTCCCNKQIVQRLAEMAYERDDHGCFKEPSARVRQAAAEALRICCPGTGPVVIEEPEPKPKRKRETVEEAPETAEGSLQAPPLPPVPDPTALLHPGTTRSGSGHLLLTSTTFGLSDSGHATSQRGVVIHADVSHRLAHVHFEQENAEVPVGTRLRVYQEDAGQLQYQGELVVVQTFPGSVNARPTAATRMHRIVPGSTVATAGGHTAAR